MQIINKYYKLEVIKANINYKTEIEKHCGGEGANQMQPYIK